MDSRAEITRAWDLFHLGAFSEAEAALLSFRGDPRLCVYASGFRCAAAIQDEVCRLGAWLAENGGEKLAAVGRAQQNVALACSAATARGLAFSRHHDGRRAEVAYARALVAFIEGAPDQVREELAQSFTATAEQRVRYATLRAWVYGLYEQFEKQSTHLLHALSLALDSDVDRGLQASIAAALAPLARELELGELGERAEALLGSVVVASRCDDIALLYATRARVAQSAARRLDSRAASSRRRIGDCARCRAPRTDFRRSHPH